VPGKLSVRESSPEIGNPFRAKTVGQFPVLSLATMPLKEIKAPVLESFQPFCSGLQSLLL
jgi:hypothetical protein